MYQIIVPNNCQKFLLKLGDYDYNKIKDKVLLLENNPRPRGCLQLSDSQQYRVRCGNYRIVYEIDDDKKIVYVYKINHRKDVYKDK
jgi:mRNA interferase RelE/StbE